MIRFARLYSEYLVTANKDGHFPTGVYIHLLKIDLFLNHQLSCIMHQCQFHFRCFPLPLVTRLLTSLQSSKFAIYKKTPASFFFFFFPFTICVFTQIMHLFHVRFCQAANF